ncbi:MAG: hypothetical protein ACI91O_001581 [Candidatus Poriferisodalaceae bacterium]|jgi:hypothetical protein
MNASGPSTIGTVSRSNYDRSGQIRPLRERSPIAYWTAVSVVAAMLLTGFAALTSVF